MQLYVITVSGIRVFISRTTQYCHGGFIITITIRIRILIVSPPCMYVNRKVIVNDNKKAKLIGFEWGRKTEHNMKCSNENQNRNNLYPFSLSCKNKN